MDEALDAAVQRAIRRTFRDATVVCIAHRINTIHDYDRVLVLDDEVVEDGVPAVLAKDPSSVFGGLARSHDAGSVLAHFWHWRRKGRERAVRNHPKSRKTRHSAFSE